MPDNLLELYEQRNVSLRHTSPYIWTTKNFTDFYTENTQRRSKRSAERFLLSSKLVDSNLNLELLVDEHARPIKQLVAQNLHERICKQRAVSVFIRLYHSPCGITLLANNARQARFWVHIDSTALPTKQLDDLLSQLAETISKRKVIYWPSGNLCTLFRELNKYPHNTKYELAMSAYSPSLNFDLS